MLELPLACATGIVASFLLDRGVSPHRAPLRRAAPSLAVHASLVIIAFLGILVVLQRPMLAMGAVLIAQSAMVVVSNAKWRALREPLVHSDFGLFAQALRHPRLYLPYLPIAPAALGASFALAAGAAGMRLEGATPTPFVAWSALMLIAALVTAWGTFRGLQSLSFDPRNDVERNGLIATLWLYWVKEKVARRAALPPVPWDRMVRREAKSAPHIVAVQSESFFDARRLYDGICDSVLANFDVLAAQGISGRLAVPAWGAYTMRTEFAFLSGIRPDALGVNRFNPYRHVARRPVPTLAARLRALGYRTLCVHPYSGSFFDRYHVMRCLGFEEFLDLGAFHGAARAGPYVADMEVARKVIELLERSRQPTFVFAITMENHGPLHLEQIPPDDAKSLFRGTLPAGFDDLAVYLRHLRNADRMLGELAVALEKENKDGVLCAFGDHVPSMPALYDALAYRDARTDYVLWRARGRYEQRIDLPVEALGHALCALAGFDLDQAGTRPTTMSRRSSHATN